GTGNLDATGNYNGIVAANNGNINIYGGKIKATGNEGTGINAYNDVNISGGQVTANGTLDCINANNDVNISGGQVTANGTEGIYANYGAINLSWTKSTDFIDASSYSKTPTFAEGKRFYDQNGNIYDASGTPSGKISALDGYIVEIQEGITITSDNATRIGTTNKYICAAGEVLTLSTGTNAAFEKITGIKNATADGNAYTYTVTGDSTLEPVGFSIITGLTFDYDGEYYKISSLADLQALANYVNAGNNCAGLTFKLTADISGVNFHIGTFSGTFDGNNHKITVNYGTETARIANEGCALFNGLNNATVRGLTVDGTIYTSNKYAAGLVVNSNNTVNIENCRSSVIINSTCGGDGSHSGFVGAVVSGTTNITDCIFDGEFIGADTHSWGGFIGWKGTNANITNCLFNPNYLYVYAKTSAAFSRNGANISNSYYTTDLNDNTNYTNQGTKIYRLTIPDDLTASGNFVEFGGNKYAVENTQVTLTVNNDNSFHKVTGISGATFDGENYTCTVGTSDVEFKLEGFPKIDGLTFNSEGDYYEIGTTDALNALATYVNGGHDCAGLTFKQTADIDLTGKDFTAISDFKGTFDGDGKLITTSSAIFSGDTGTISGGYYYGTSGNGFTQVYKINLPSDVEVDGAISFGGQ
ncbi:MAG: hypothetical protein IKT98_10295, partial [Selenomonadaceae bacterium]|nr:hypothetical protein [Selenomonadaceae bacterium]